MSKNYKKLKNTTAKLKSALEVFNTIIGPEENLFRDLESKSEELSENTEGKKKKKKQWNKQHGQFCVQSGSVCADYIF